MIVTLDNRIRLPVRELPPVLRKKIKKEFKYGNPEYYKKKNMGIWVGDTQRYIATFKLEDKGQTLTLPRGAQDRLEALLDAHGVDYSIRDQRNKGQKVEYTMSPDFKLRPYQLEAIDAIFEHETCLLEKAPASGKTEAILGAIARSGLRAAIIVHNKLLQRQWIKRITKRLGIPAREIGRIGGGGKARIGDRITVMLQRSALNRLPMIKSQFGFVCHDECFPGYTLVDDKPIKDYKIGDPVTCYDHVNDEVVVGHVKTKFRNRCTEIARIKFIDGSEIICTPSHPFYDETIEDYRPACCLTSSSVLLYKQENSDEKNTKVNNNNVNDLWFLQQNRIISNRQYQFLGQLGQEAISFSILFWRLLFETLRDWEIETSGKNNKNEMLSLRDHYVQNRQDCNIASQAWSGILQFLMQRCCGAQNECQNYGENQQEIQRGIQRTYVDKESDERKGHDRENAEHIIGDRAYFQRTWWQWSWSNKARKSVERCLTLAYQCYSFCRETAVRLSNTLQNRCWQQRIENSNRNRWEFSHHTQKKNARQEKRDIFERKRVESIEIYERGRGTEFERLCPEGFVYNLEVTPHHNYFVNNILAHNCHHASARTFLELIDNLNSYYRIGVSGTVKRKDLKHFLIYDLFGEVRYKIEREELVEMGYLTEIAIEVVHTNFYLDYMNVDQLQKLHNQDKIEIEQTTGKERRKVLAKLGIPEVTYNDYLDAATADAGRNNLIFHWVKEELDRDSKVIIFTRRRKHCTEWATRLERIGVPIVVLWGVQKKADKDRQARDLDKLIDGSVRVGIGTVLDEGLDMPVVQAGFITYRNARNAAQLEQQAGRLARLFSGKTEGRLYYFHDHRITKFDGDVRALKRRFKKVTVHERTKRRKKALQKKRSAK